MTEGIWTYAANVTGKRPQLGSGRQGLSVLLQGPYVNPVQRPGSPKLGVVMIRTERNDAILLRSSHCLNVGAASETPGPQI